MRKLALVPLAVLLMAASFGGRATLFTDMSTNYWVSITATPSADGSDYDVLVRDRKTNLPVVQRRLSASPGHPAENAIDGGPEQFKLRLEPYAEGLRAQFNVDRAGKSVDSFDVYWDTVQPPGPMSSEGKPLVGGYVKAPVVVNRIEPVYTDAAKRNRLKGAVIAEVLVDTNGFAREVRILKPLPDGLTDSAIDALRQWRFQPATQNGQPVDAVFGLSLKFPPAD